jgi:transcriptional regulator with XRE-family HTH domain
MIDLILESPKDICRAVAERARAARLAANLTQEGLAQRSGVSLGSLKRFESSGAASLEAVVRIAVALRMESGFERVFQSPRFSSLDEVIAAPKRRIRGTRK